MVDQSATPTPQYVEAYQKVGTAILSITPVLTAYVLILGISFDVCYYLGFGIDFFTIFTLSEHLLFSLEIAPIALLAVVEVAFVALLLEPTRKLIANRTGSTRRARWFSILIMLSLLTALFAAMHKNFWSIFPASIVALDIISLGLLFTLIYLRSESKPFSLMALPVLAAPILMSSGIGYDAGSSYYNPIFMAGRPPQHAFKLQDKTEVRGWLIRAGSNGVLLISHEHLPTFKRWEAVVEIRALRTAQFRKSLPSPLPGDPL